MSPRTHIALAVLLAVVGILGAATFGALWYRAYAVNALIEVGDPDAIAEDAPFAARFAKAYALRHRGKPQAAGELYRELLPQADGMLERALHYNLANLYFWRAAVAADETRLRDVVPLVLRARTHYQRVLYLDSDNYDARYNLEYVERLMQDRAWQAENSKVGASAKRSEGGTGWVSVHELPDGLP